MEKEHYPRVWAAVLTYNGIDHLRYSVPSVCALQYPNLVVSVADNASTDGSVDFISESFPAVRLMSNDANLGFTGAANLAIRTALTDGAEYLLILTNDMLIDRRAVKYAVQAAGDDPKIGIVGFRFFGGQRYEPQERFHDACLEWTTLEVGPDSRIEGAAMFVRLSLFRHIGLFDNAYFMYAEETDLQIRAAKAGYRFVRTNLPAWHNAIDPDARITKRVAWLSARNEIRCAMKNHGFLMGLRATKTLLSRACNPFLPKQAMASRHSQRSRPSNPLFNGLLVLAALSWNTLRFPQTVRQRRRESAMIEQGPGGTI